MRQLDAGEKLDDSEAAGCRGQLGEAGKLDAVGLLMLL